ncbi:hypothetical protein [Streptomyces sp. NPDC051561]|uniref:hypothetical protein n=1 Tax=Streptomyces sp. NPDC051561 TaxID=3365658 RepID=UPI00378D0DF8
MTHMDPTDPETYPAEETEGGTPLSDEAPEADTAEQHTDVIPDHQDPTPAFDPAAADEADATEQSRTVPLDEDDYR